MSQAITLDGLIRQARVTRRLGPLAGILKYIPVHVPLERDESALRRIEALISSLLPEERRQPRSISDERITEVAHRIGLSEGDVRKFFRQFEVMGDQRGS